MADARGNLVSPDGDLLRFQLRREQAAETLYVSGELDIASAPALERMVAGAMDGQGGEFHLDVRALTFIDSTGAMALLRVHRRVESLGRTLVVVSPTDAVRRVLELLRLDDVLDVRA